MRDDKRHACRGKGPQEPTALGGWEETLMLRTGKPSWGSRAREEENRESCLAPCPAVPAASRLASGTVPTHYQTLR